MITIGERLRRGRASLSGRAAGFFVSEVVRHTNAVAVHDVALTDASGRDGHAAEDRTEQIELPHFHTIGRVPGRDDESAADGAANHRLDVRCTNAERFTFEVSDDSAASVGRVGVRDAQDWPRFGMSTRNRAMDNQGLWFALSCTRVWVPVQDRTNTGAATARALALLVWTGERGGAFDMVKSPKKRRTP